jgi:hypothetical protein
MRSTFRDDIDRRLVGVDTKAGLGCFDRAGGIEGDAATGLADVGRAQVEGLAGQMHANRIQIPAADALDADDVAAARGNELLHQSDVVEAEIEAPALAAASRSAGVSKRTIPTPLPPTLGLTTTGNRSPSAAAGASSAAWIHARPWPAQTEAGEYGELERFGQLMRECPRAIDDAHARTFEVTEPRLRVEQRVS